MEQQTDWEPDDVRVPVHQLVSVAIERTLLAWEEVDRRDPEKGWGG
ncbi:hypothetical protein [Kitasatospora sp. Ki12]